MYKQINTRKRWWEPWKNYRDVKKKHKKGEMLYKSQVSLYRDGDMEINIKIVVWEGSMKTQGGAGSRHQC